MTLRNKKRFHLSTGAVALIACAIAIAAAAFSWWQLTRYEDNLLEIFAQQQDQYVKLAVDQIDREEGRTDADIVDKVLGSISGSASQYWTLSKKNGLIFVKDVTDSSRYRGFSSKTYYNTDTAQAFIEGLSTGRVDHAIIQIDGRDFIASGTKFKYNGHTYSLCLLTGKRVVIDQNAYLAARVNLGVTIGAVLVIFVGACVGLSLRNDATNKRLRAAEADAVGLRKTVEQLNDQIMGRRKFDTMRSLFDMGQAPVLLSKLRAAGKVPSTFVSLRFDSANDLSAFARRAVGVLDTSVVRLADGPVLLLVFIGAEADAAEYALSLLGEDVDGDDLGLKHVKRRLGVDAIAVRIPHAATLGTYVLRAGDDATWRDVADALGIDD